MLLTATEINRLLYHVLYNGVTDAISYCSEMYQHTLKAIYITYMEHPPELLGFAGII